LPLDRVLQTLPAFTTTSTLTPPAAEGRSDEELLPGLRWPSPWCCCSIPSAPHPPSNAAAAVRPRIRTRAAALIHLAAPATAGAGGEARGSVGGTESEAIWVTSAGRGASPGRAGARAGARALAGWLASGRIGSCSCPPPPPAWPGESGSSSPSLVERNVLEPEMQAVCCCCHARPWIRHRPAPRTLVSSLAMAVGGGQPSRGTATTPTCGPNPTPLSDDGGMATDRKCLWPCDSPTKAK
jgi:hypothetical protein